MNDQEKLFQLQLFLANLVLLVAWAVPSAFRWVPLRWAAAPMGLALIAAIIHLLFLGPVWFGRVPEAEPGEKTFTVMAVNVHTANRDFDHVLSLIRAEEPHVLFLLEVDTAWREALAPLDDMYPFHRWWVSDHDNFGIAGLCRVPGARGRLRNLSPKTAKVSDTIHVVFPWRGREVEVRMHLEW